MPVTTVFRVAFVIPIRANDDDAQLGSERRLLADWGPCSPPSSRSQGGGSWRALGEQRKSPGPGRGLYESSRPLNRLMLAQDTGGAIRGAVRADFFWGFGEEAAREAGRMKQPLRMGVLLPNAYRVPQ